MMMAVSMAVTMGLCKVAQLEHAKVDLMAVMTEKKSVGW